MTLKSFAVRSNEFGRRFVVIDNSHRHKTKSRSSPYSS